MTRRREPLAWGRRYRQSVAWRLVANHSLWIRHCRLGRSDEKRRRMCLPAVTARELGRARFRISGPVT